MLIAGAARTNEALASSLMWKAVPLKPLIVPRVGTTVRGEPPGMLTKTAEGFVDWKGVVVDVLNASWLTGVSKNAGLSEITSPLSKAEPAPVTERSPG